MSTQEELPYALAVQANGPTSVFDIASRLSTLCWFLADDERLLVIAKPHVDQASADMALAWGLAYRGDRQLSVLVPELKAEPTLVRAPWFVPPVRVLTYVDRVVAEPTPMSRSRSIRRYRHWIEELPAELGEKATWIGPLLEWLRTVPAIDAQARNSYVSWHVHGRQVLKIVPSKTRLTIVAGVDAKGEFHGRTPERLDLSGPASDHVVLRLVSATALAAADRLQGIDNTHVEHRLQGLLRPEMLHLQSWKREFPAWRPGQKRTAFIDFIGTDPNGRVSIVETKIGPDTMLVLQGLDYWLWCRANDDNLGRALRTDTRELPEINFVVAPKEAAGDVISRYTAAQLEALHPIIPWRFWVLEDSISVTSVERLRRQEVPQGRRAGSTPSRWSVRLHRHALAAAADTGVSLVDGHTHPVLSDSLLPEALAEYQRLHAQGLVHGYIGHVRSSQAFALNMLAPLSNQAWTAIARRILGHQHCEVLVPPHFEYSDPADDLHEATRASAHVTQVDCLVRIALRGGSTHLLVIEVKLSEDAFSTCSAFESRRNPRKYVCSSPLPFGGDTAGCFQLCNHDRGERRRYDLALAIGPSEPAGSGCWFRDGANQVMRNTALARQLIERNEAVSASVVLMAPDDHVAIWEQWREHTRRLAAVDRIRFGELTASQVAALHDPATARQLSSRYMLPNDLLEVRLAQRVADRRFPSGVYMRRVENDGSTRYDQRLDRLPVIGATRSHFRFLTPYPAGPFVHTVAHADWSTTDGDITVPDESGDGTRVFSSDLSRVDPGDRDALRAGAERFMRDQPWWTAPLQLDAYW